MKLNSSMWVFVLITFGFSWLFWVPDALIAQNIVDAPEGVKDFLALNAELAEVWENITEKKDPLPDAEDWAEVTGKMEHLER